MTTSGRSADESGEDELTSSAAGSRASRGAPPASASAPKTHATCGPRWPASSVRSDLGSSSPRMSPCPHSENPSTTFDEWGIACRRLSASVHATLARRSYESGGGFSLPTLTCSPETGNSTRHKKLLPTLIRQDGVTTRRGANSIKKGGGRMLLDALLPTLTATQNITCPSMQKHPAHRTLATLTARDWRSGKASEATHARNSRPLPEQLGGLLHPDFCDWYQGMPVGWSRGDLASKPSAMRRFLRWLRSHSRSCSEN